MTTQHNTAREPSRTSRATRSLRLADRLYADGKRDEFRGAIAQHFAEFAPVSHHCALD